jgi:microcystin-dependent protein
LLVFSWQSTCLEPSPALVDSVGRLSPGEGQPTQEENDVEPYIGQIIQFDGNFAIRGWAKCDGQLLSINTNSSLFSILGTTYGGDGVSTFGLPDLRGRTALYAGNGPGLTTRSLGQRSGTETVKLTVDQMPAHGYTAKATDGLPNETSPQNNLLAQQPASQEYRSWTSPQPTVAMSPAAISSSGGDGSHSNMMPFLVVTWLIALTGAYPSRN